MKKLFLLITVATCGSLLLSSCGALQNFSITKRHYRSGFYVDLGSRKQDATVPKTSQTETATATTSITAEEKNTVIPETKMMAAVPVISVSKAENKRQPRKHTASNVYASTGNASAIAEQVQAEQFRNYVATLPDISATSSSSSGGAAPMLLVVLFAILIPPIGVALKFGFDSHFWISLLLTLLFFIPGMIYSLIVVLQ